MNIEEEEEEWKSSHRPEREHSAGQKEEDRGRQRGATKMLQASEMSHETRWCHSAWLTLPDDVIISDAHPRLMLREKLKKKEAAQLPVGVSMLAC